MHELFELIRANEEVLNHPFFVSVVQRLPAVNRRAWQALVDVALGATPTDPFGKRLLLLRNKIFFHYDPKAIFIGYGHFFVGADRRQDRAYVSRGDRMRSTRLYFADAAAEGYLYHLVGADQAEDLKLEIGDVVDKVNNGLMTLVLTYIQRRGYSFRTEAES